MSAGANMDRPPQMKCIFPSLPLARLSRHRHPPGPAEERQECPSGQRPDPTAPGECTPIDISPEVADEQPADGEPADEEPTGEGEGSESNNS